MYFISQHQHGDKSWEAKFDFVIYLNTGYGRGQFPHNCVFAGWAKLVDWVDLLKWLDTTGLPKNKQEEFHNANFLFSVCWRILALFRFKKLVAVSMERGCVAQYGAMMYRQGYDETDIVGQVIHT